jgi:hypothetical protein
LVDTIAGTVLGGFIAGLVGLVTARYERSLRRREGHMREHEKNFDAIQESLVDLKSQLWPLTAKGAENLALPKWDKPPQAQQLSRYSITGYQRFEPVSGDPLSTKFKVISVDRVLYTDMPNHFPSIARKLDQIESMARDEGVRLDRLVYEVTTEIWKTMAISDVTVLRWTFDQGKKALLRDIASVDSLESRGYGGFLFLILIGEDPANWPINYRILEQYGLLEGLKIVADKIKQESGNKISDMLHLRKRIFALIDDCDDVLELEKHKISLKGKCQYL